MSAPRYRLPDGSIVTLDQLEEVKEPFVLVCGFDTFSVREYSLMSDGEMRRDIAPGDWQVVLFNAKDIAEHILQLMERIKLLEAENATQQASSAPYQPASRVCRFTGCGKRNYAKGVCLKHYNGERQRARGLLAYSERDARLIGALGDGTSAEEVAVEFGLPLGYVQRIEAGYEPEIKTFASLSAIGDGRARYLKRLVATKGGA